jgi:hypothetical protein
VVLLAGDEEQGRMGFLKSILPALPRVLRGMSRLSGTT